MVFDLVVFGFFYAILRAFLFVRDHKRKSDDDSDDDEGGLPVNSPPDIDLPPGVCLPDDLTRRRKSEPEEVFA